MPLSPEAEDKAQALRAQGVQALRAGRVGKARAAFLQSLRYDPEQAVTFLWLAGLAATEEEARRLLDHARRLDPDHPQLARVARGIDGQFARAGRVFPSSGHPPTAEALRSDEDIAEPSIVPLRSGSFVNQPPLPTSRSEVWTTLVLDGVGAGQARLSRLGTSAGLARAFDSSARRVGARTTDLDDWRLFFVTNSSRMSRGGAQVLKSYQGVVVTRSGDELSGTEQDKPERLDLQRMAEIGKAATHFVMVTSSR